MRDSILRARLANPGGALDPKQPVKIPQRVASGEHSTDSSATTPASTSLAAQTPRSESTTQDSIAAERAHQAALDSIQRATAPKATAPEPAPTTALPAPPPPAPPPAPPPSADPVVDRERASEALSVGGRQFVEAANAKRAVSLIHPTEDAKRRTRFAKFLTESLDAASLGTVEGVTILSDHSEATAGITFRYRDDFGVAKKREVKLKVIAIRNGALWRFEGVRLLEAFP